MKKTAVSLVVIAAVALWVTLPSAYAGSPWKNRVGSLRSGGGSFLGGRSSSSRSGRSGLSGLSRMSGRSGRSGLSGLSGLSGGSRNGSGLAELARGIGQLHGLDGNRQSNGSGLGELLGAYGNHGGYGSSWNGYGQREDQMAKAYRDVGIANAVVGLVGVLVTASQNANYTTVAPAPAPVSAPPAGHWERQTVVVQPAHYETYQEWIPEIFDSRTGQKIGGGYHESRTRLVPETLQHRDVWVTP